MSTGVDVGDWLECYGFLCFEYEEDLRTMNIIVRYVYILTCLQTLCIPTFSSSMEFTFDFVYLLQK